MFSRAQTWCIHAGAGHFPDADMLPVGAILQDYGPDGWTKFTKDEQITMMSLWCIMRSPLMIGGEMTKFDDFTMSLLTNADLIDCLTTHIPLTRCSERQLTAANRSHGSPRAPVEIRTILPCSTAAKRNAPSLRSFR